MLLLDRGGKKTEQKKEEKERKTPLSHICSEGGVSYMVPRYSLLLASLFVPHSHCPCIVFCCPCIVIPTSSHIIIWCPHIVVWHSHVVIHHPIPSPLFVVSSLSHTATSPVFLVLGYDDMKVCNTPSMYRYTESWEWVHTVTERKNRHAEWIILF